MLTHAQAEQLMHRGFLIHLGVYVPVVAGLMAMNFSRHPEKPWSLWVAGGWGLGVALHASLVYLIPQAREKIVERTIARVERREARRAQRPHARHHVGT